VSTSSFSRRLHLKVRSESIYGSVTCVLGRVDLAGGSVRHTGKLQDTGLVIFHAAYLNLTKVDPRPCRVLLIVMLVRW
jgi:hypothetical protein